MAVHYRNDLWLYSGFVHFSFPKGSEEHDLMMTCSRSILQYKNRTNTVTALYYLLIYTNIFAYQTIY